MCECFSWSVDVRTLIWRNFLSRELVLGKDVWHPFFYFIIILNGDDSNT